MPVCVCVCAYAYAYAHPYVCVCQLCYIGELLALQDDKPARVEFGGDIKFVSVAAGPQHSLAVAQDGSVYAWGDVAEGQLGLDHAGRSAVLFHTNAARRWCEERSLMFHPTPW